MNPSEQRKTGRYETLAAVDFSYDFNATLEVHPLGQHDSLAEQTYKGIMRNVSSEGICFNSDHELHQGDILNLDIFLKGNEAVHVQGMVRWTKEISSTEAGHHFDTGVKVIAIEGKPVEPSVKFDRQHGIYWSDVLESILGKYRLYMQQEKKT